jgi:hypothetical protein
MILWWYHRKKIKEIYILKCYDFRNDFNNNNNNNKKKKDCEFFSSPVSIRPIITDFSKYNENSYNFDNDDNDDNIFINNNNDGDFQWMKMNYVYYILIFNLFLFYKYIKLYYNNI